MEYVKNMCKFNKLCSLILESPYLNYTQELKQDIQKQYVDNNKERYNITIKVGKFLKDINFNSKNLQLFLNLNSNYNLNIYSIVYAKEEKYVATFTLQNLEDNNFELGSVWSSEKGLMNYLWNNFILNLDWKTIRCDGQRTEAGKKWFDNTILKPLLANSEFKCYVENIDMKEKYYLQTIEEFEQYYSKNYFKTGKYRIIIEKL